MNEFVTQLDSVIDELDFCIEQDEELLTNLAVYAQQAEAHASMAHGPALVLFKKYRASRPPIPNNHHALQKLEFARRNLQQLGLGVVWSDHEKTVLRNALLRLYNRSDVDSNEVDWNRVVHVCRSIDSEFLRSEKSCSIQFTNHPDDSPPWTAEDDRILTALVTETNGTDWRYIGSTLKRSPADCFSRSCTLLNPILVPTSFSERDDATLAKLVKEHGESAWSTIAIEMGTGHTGPQLSTRWTKTLKPGIDSGRWNPVLDARLKAAVQIYGDKKWSVVAEHVPGKTDRKCRERYSEKLAPGLKINHEWDEEEDTILLREVSIHGAGNWSKIKLALPGRTDQMCRYRYKKLQQDS